jgi:hypothetical protein
MADDGLILPRHQFRPAIIRHAACGKRPIALYWAAREHTNASTVARGLAHRRWLAGQKFDHAAQQIVFQEGIDASKILFSACVALRSNSVSSCRNGPWRRWWKPIKPCVALRFSSP